MTVTLKTMITDWLRIKTQVGTPATPASGYSVIYEEGGALKLKTDAGTITTFGASTISDTAYDATSWDGVTTIAPSKNAVRDKFESLTSVLNDYILVRDEKAQNTAGGTFTSGAWRTRDITAEVSDTGGHCSLPGSNVIRLAAGTYTYKISCPALFVTLHKARLYDVTAGAMVANGEGTTEDSQATAGEFATRSFIVGKFTCAGTNDYRIEHWCTATNNTNGFGKPSNIDKEIYTIAEFWKVA